MGRFQSDEAFESLNRGDLPEVAIEACRLAVHTSGIEDAAALTALRALERRNSDARVATSMRDLADRLDQDAWDSRDPAEYELLFRRARAVSALAFALSEEPAEAIYEAAHAVGTPEDLLRQLRR